MASCSLSVAVRSAWVFLILLDVLPDIGKILVGQHPRVRTRAQFRKIGLHQVQFVIVGRLDGVPRQRVVEVGFANHASSN